jgi:hypothetical protein
VRESRPLMGLIQEEVCEDYERSLHDLLAAARDAP